MFKKSSEEQEWSRFRGALSKDRDDAQPTTPTVSDTNEAMPAAPAPGAPGAPSGSSTFRSASGDVNVGVQSTRLSRSVVGDGGDVESLIGERTNFEGTLKSEGAVRLLGSVQGEINSKSTIIVEEKAHVTARLTAAQVTVAGQVDGQIFCEGRCEIRPTGRVTGEIHAGALIIQEGAYFDGNSKMATAAGPSGSGSGSGSGAGMRSESSAAGAGAASGRG